MGLYSCCPFCPAVKPHWVASIISGVSSGTAQLPCMLVSGAMTPRALVSLSLVICVAVGKHSTGELWLCHPAAGYPTLFDGRRAIDPRRQRHARDAASCHADVTPSLPGRHGMQRRQRRWSPGWTVRRRRGRLWGHPCHTRCTQC